MSGGDVVAAAAMTSLQQQPLPPALCAPAMSASAPPATCESTATASVAATVGELSQQLMHQRSCSESEAPASLVCERKRRGSTGGARVWSANMHTTSR